MKEKQSRNHMGGVGGVGGRPKREETHVCIELVPFGVPQRLTLEKAMAPHSSTLAWKIPGTGEPGGLPSMGSHRVGHDWSDLAAAAVVMILVFWMLSFKPTFSLSSFTFIKRLFHSSSLSAIMVVSSEVIDISPSNLDSSLCFFQPSISHDVLCI